MCETLFQSSFCGAGVLTMTGGGSALGTCGTGCCGCTGSVAAGCARAAEEAKTMSKATDLFMVRPLEQLACHPQVAGMVWRTCQTFNAKPSECAWFHG